MTSCTYNCLMNVINIGNSIIGVSILAMPYCFRKCGILLSIVLMIISGLLTKLACFLILKSAMMARRRSFEFLVIVVKVSVLITVERRLSEQVGTDPSSDKWTDNLRNVSDCTKIFTRYLSLGLAAAISAAFHTFGSYGKLAVEMCVIGFLIGVCIAFFVVIGDLGPPLAAEFLNIENSTNLRTNVLMLVGLCVALPLGLLRKIDSLTSLSALSIAFYVCLILKIFAEAVPNLSENEWWYEVNWWRSDGLLPCLPIFSMALSCQTQLFEFFDTTNEPSLKRMQSVIDGAVCLCSAVYLMVGVFGYIAFYDKNITGNILVLLTPSIVTEFIKLGFILTVAVSFPLCLFPCRSSLHSLLFKQGLVHHDPNVNIIPDHRFRILTISLVIVTIGIAIMLPNIEFVLGIIGSTIGTLICLILPAIIFIYDSNKITSERRKAQILFGVGIFILVACTFSTLHENNHREETIPHEIPKTQKTPTPLLVISSLAPVIIQSPKILLKDQPIIQEEKKIEMPDTKIEDQKRLEPPVPQEPDVKVLKDVGIKVETNGDLDPQALQKEDKELQKDSHPSANSVASSKKDEGFDKQEKVLKKLEEQHEEQKLILEQQKKILEELKQHKESHEELKRIELVKKQESKNDIQVSTASAVKQDKMEIQTVVKAELVKNVLVLENEHKVDQNSQSNILLDKNYEIESPGKFKNISLDGISKQKTSGIIVQVEEKNRMEDSNIKEKVLLKKVSHAENVNKSIDVKPDTSFLSKNITFNAVSKDKSINSNIPSFDKKVTKQFDVQEDIKSSEMRVKRRETLAKKSDFEGTISLPKNSIDVNKIGHNNDQSKT